MDVEREQEWRDYITEGSGDPWRAVTYLEEALEALDHARSWPGLMEFIDRTWPAEVFTGESGDVGPRFIVVLRQLDAERAKVAVAREALKRAKDDMQWMFGAWDGSMGEAETTALPIAHENIAAIDEALAKLDGTS